MGKNTASHKGRNQRGEERKKPMQVSRVRVRVVTPMDFIGSVLSHGEFNSALTVHAAGMCVYLGTDNCTAAALLETIRANMFFVKVVLAKFKIAAHTSSIDSSTGLYCKVSNRTKIYCITAVRAGRSVCTCTRARLPFPYSVSFLFFYNSSFGASSRIRLMKSAFSMQPAHLSSNWSLRIFFKTLTRCFSSLMVFKSIGTS